MNIKENKFRVWDMDNNKMIYPKVLNGLFEVVNGNQFYLDGLGNPVLILYPYVKNPPLFNKDRFVVMQYITSIKHETIHDKFVDVYEGDVIEYGDYDSNAHARSYYHSIVEFSDDGCFVLGINGEHNEVVGNIYENPELLDQIKKEEDSVK